MKRDPIPLYPDEERVALEVMGPKRAKEWPAKARFLEDKEGLPPIDTFMGGRFWPAVVEYFRVKHGVNLPDGLDGGVRPQPSSRVRVVPFKPDGQENFDAAKASAHHGGLRPRRSARGSAGISAHQEEER